MTPLVVSCCRRAKEDFELGGKLIRKGSLILADLMYAKAGDERVSAGDHIECALPAHMDIHRLGESFRPERWLDEANKLDASVRDYLGT
jgi:cytochrome P450